MKLFKNIGIGVVCIVLFFALGYVMTSLACLGESRGTMVVMGGNSFRCQ